MDYSQRKRENVGELIAVPSSVMPHFRVRREDGSYVRCRRFVFHVGHLMQDEMISRMASI